MIIISIKPETDWLAKHKHTGLISAWHYGFLWLLIHCRDAFLCFTNSDKWKNNDCLFKATNNCRKHKIMLLSYLNLFSGFLVPFNIGTSWHGIGLLCNLVLHLPSCSFFYCSFTYYFQPLISISQIFFILVCFSFCLEFFSLSFVF